MSIRIARGAHISDVLADWARENDFETSFIVPVGNSDPKDVAHSRPIYRKGT